MQRIRLGIISLLLFVFVPSLTGFTNQMPPLAISLLEGRTYDQAHDTGYLDWSGPVSYVYLTHRDGSSLPPTEGGTSCMPSCQEWVTRIPSGGVVSGTFDRDVSYFEVMVAFSHDSSVGVARLTACSASQTSNLYLGPGGGLPGFVSVVLSVPAGCRTWSVSSSSGYTDFRSVDVTYNAPPPTPTYTVTPSPSFTPTLTMTSTATITPSPTNTPTLTPTSTYTPTATFTPTATATPSQTTTNTPSPTPTPLPPMITGQVVCDQWGDAGWCKGNEILELVASDPQGFSVTISGDINSVTFSCGSSCSLPLPEGVGTANYTATSASGRTVSGLSTWQRDSTPPILNILAPPVDGRNGWYVSEVDVSVNASDAISGLSSVAGSLDNGVTWSSLPIHLTDGVHSVVVRARDVAGNEAMETKVIRIDTIPPVAQFTSHSNGEVLHGNVMLRGSLEDETSGATYSELSLDGGSTWQAVSMGLDNTWAFTWHTNELSNGQYMLQMHGMDQAGNGGEAASITLIVDNGPPHVSITERWWIWESGKLEISPNHFPIANVKVTISDPQNGWPAVVMEFDPDKVPGSISWNRRFADGTLAPSGAYRVEAVACDVHDLCASDIGIIDIPFAGTSTATLTPSPTTTSTVIPQSTPTATVTIKPATATPVLTMPSPDTFSEPTQPTGSITFWQVFGLFGLFLVMASVSVIDPRPAALKRLRESVQIISEQNISDSSPKDE